MWLSNQFDLIRCLIQTSPRDQLNMPSTDTLPISTAQTKSVPLPIGTKRKSSTEGYKHTVGVSPHLKRTSNELIAILEELGLPTDLQKLRKDQLVHELIQVIICLFFPGLSLLSFAREDSRSFL